MNDHKNLLTRREYLHWIASLGLFTHVSTADAQTGVTKQRILIGQSLSLQSGKNEYGVAVLEGIHLYLSQINHQGGVHGRQIELMTLDDHARAQQATLNAVDLITKHGVFALFGSIEGGPSNAVLKVATEHQVPFWGPMAGSPTLRTPYNPWVFPVRADHKEEFNRILEHARVMGLTRVGFLRSASPVGVLHLENVQRLCHARQLEFVADLSFGDEVNDAQIEAMVETISHHQVQVVFNHGSAGVYERLIRSVRAKGLRTMFYGVNSGSTQLTRHLGSLAVGMGFTQVVPNPRTETTPLARAFRSQFLIAYPGKEPSYAHMEGYITMWVFIEALKRTGAQPTRDSLIAGALREPFDLLGTSVTYTPSKHTGMSWIQLAFVGRDGVMRH